MDVFSDLLNLHGQILQLHLRSVASVQRQLDGSNVLSNFRSIYKSHCNIRYRV
jgi:hypothetical protein